MPAAIFSTVAGQCLLQTGKLFSDAHWEGLRQDGSWDGRNEFEVGEMYVRKGDVVGL
jgi:hypothetical protein